MAITFGTPAWAGRLQDEINASSEYRNAARSWGVDFNGNLLFAFEPDASLREPVHLLIRLKAGSCQGACFVDGADHPEAGFSLRAPFGVWRDVLDRKTLAATAILTGKMRVEGDKMTLLRFIAANRALVHCTASLDTGYPWDEE